MPLPLVIDNRVRVPIDGLPDDVVAALRATCEHDNPAFHKLARMGVPTWGEKRVVRTWQHHRTETGEYLSFPRGALARVRAALEEAGEDWEEVDERQPGLPADIPDHKVELYPFQEKLVQAGMARENCILKAATGSGKTSAALALIGRLKLPTVVLVHNRGLHEQWVTRAQKELGVRPKDLGKIGGGTWRVGELTIAMHATLSQAFGRGDPRALKLAEDTGALFFDEVHLASAKSYFASVDPFRARYRIGISADHRRRDGKEFLTLDLFGAVAAEAGREQLIDAGFVLDVEVRVVGTRFEADWYEGFATGSESRGDYGRLLAEMGADEARTQQAVDAALAEVAAGEQVLVMCHRRDLCRLIDQKLVAHGVKTGFLVGDAPQEFDATVKALASGRVRVAVGTYQAVGTGIDLPRVGVGVCVTPVAANEQNFNQVRGRLCRTAQDKNFARLYYLLDRGLPFAEKHLRNLRRWNRSVSEPDGSGGWAPLRSSRGRHKRSR